jgi:hypothetical protein
MADVELHVNPDPQTRKRKIVCKQELIVQSLQQFYANRSDLTEILKILEGESEMSLRLIDWFVTNYSKFHNISYIHKNQDFFVYIDYKNQLKAYSKKLFDPFCRRERILFQVGPYPSFLTTVGKLNFFRWALEKGILDYIKLNMAKIETAMNASSREMQKARKAVSVSTTATTATTSSTRSSTRKRLVAAEPPNSKLMQKHDYVVEVRFD